MSRPNHTGTRKEIDMFAVDVAITHRISDTSNYSYTACMDIERLGMVTVEAAIKVRKSALYAELPVGTVMSGTIYVMSKPNLARIAELPFTMVRLPDGERSYIELTC